MFTAEVLKYDGRDRASKSAVSNALSLFRSSFDPLIMENGKDLLEMVCTAYETPNEDCDEEEEPFDFSAQQASFVRCTCQCLDLFSNVIHTQTQYWMRFWLCNCT